MQGWIWFENSKKAVNTNIQRMFELDDEDGSLWFRDQNGYIIRIVNLEDVANFLKNVAKVY